MPERQLRLVAFRSTSEDAVLDMAIRERVLPGIHREPNVEQLWAGRRGPAQGGGRLLVSVRTDLAGANDAAAGDPSEVTALLALGPDLVIRAQVDRIEILPVATSVCFERPASPRLLRVYRGQVVPGRLDEYVARAHEGALADGATIPGLYALSLATDGSERFVTVSAWLDWGSVERATGGDIRRPMATRHAELIAHGEVTHYEILPAIGAIEGHDPIPPIIGA